MLFLFPTDVEFAGAVWPGVTSVAIGRRAEKSIVEFGDGGSHVVLADVPEQRVEVTVSQELTADDWWADHIDHAWSGQQVRRVLEGVPGLQLQPQTEQTPFKISFYYDEQHAPGVDEIVDMIREKELTANVFWSFGQFLDIVPSRASKGQAVRYLSWRLDIPLEHMLVAGGSGADEDMMRGNTLAVVVGNRHHEELSRLLDLERIYFARQPHAFGILEAIEHYDFFDTCKARAAR